MKRYLVAFKLSEGSKAKGPKEQVKTFEVAKGTEPVIAFVAGILASSAKELVSVSRHDLTTHRTTPLEVTIERGKFTLIETTTDGGGEHA